MGVFSFRSEIGRRVAALCSLALLMLTASITKAVYTVNNDLTRYLREPEPDYRWELVSETVQSNGSRIVQLSVQSLRWAPGHYLPDHPVWKHRITLYIPPSVASDLAVLHINGGVRHSEHGSAGREYSDSFGFMDVAQAAGAIVINVRDIPNQYLRLQAHGKPLKEDDLIAQTWADYLENPDRCQTCPLQFPMTKAVIKVIDAVQAYLKEDAPGQVLLTGSSKRGWVSWLVAAQDPRVAAVMPVVMDAVNVSASMEHLHKVYGRWIASLQPYVRRGVMDRLSSPEMSQLLAQVDPWGYRDQLTLPKYIVSAAGDDFFPPDSGQFSVPGLKGPVWTLTLPNTRHYIHRGNAGAVTQAVIAFAGALTEGRTLPKVDSGQLKPEGGTVRISGVPTVIRLWQVTNPESRDFRMTTLEPAGLSYNSSVLNNTCTKISAQESSGKNGLCEITVKVERPDRGWKAWFLELRFANAPYPDFVVTTPVRVSPDRYP